MNLFQKEFTLMRELVKNPAKHKDSLAYLAVSVICTVAGLLIEIFKP